MKANHVNYYRTNSRYSSFLESQDISDFSKYINCLNKYAGGTGKVLDVGCGTGIVLDALSTKGVNIRGIDVSHTSIGICQDKGLNCRVYDGGAMPFHDDYFDIVGSFNVLEHADNPIVFLDEKVRVLKHGGMMIIACPNFLSITNNYHWHTRGIFRKIKNLFCIFVAILSIQPHFEKMTPVMRKQFFPDDDAVNVVNPISIMRWAKSRNLHIIEWSSQSTYKEGIVAFLDKLLIPKIFLGASFFICKKK